MAYAFSVRQVNASFQAHYAEPAFALFADLPGLLQQLFTRLGRLGLSLADTKFERGDDTLAQAHLRGHLFDFRTTLRIYFDRVELTSTVPAGVSLAHDTVASEAVSAVRVHMPGLELRAYTANVGLHGVPVGISAGDFLARFGSVVPRRAGPLLGVGAVFYYGAALDHLASSITVDLSRVIENGVFIQTNAIYDVQKVPLGGVTDASRGFMQEALAELGLESEAPWHLSLLSRSEGSSIGLSGPDR